VRPVTPKDRLLLLFSCLVILVPIGGCRQKQSGIIGQTVVLISLDTTRPDHMSVYGYPKPTTPRLKELAGDGVVFDQAIAVHTNTCPSHASMMTGVYPPTHGSLCNGVPVREDIPTMSELLEGQGFMTAAFVSGITLKAENCGLNRGFSTYDDHFDGFARGARATLNRTASWLWRQKSAEDIFLFFHLYDPHFEYNPPRGFSKFGLREGQSPRDPIKPVKLRNRLAGGEESADIHQSLKEWIRRYDGEIVFADWAAGQLLDTLKKMHRYDDALIIMVSDHGETLTERPWVFDHGSRVSEEQIRVPMIMKLPAGAFAGKRIPEAVSHIDLLPTVLAQLGISVPPGLAGMDLHDLFRGDGNTAEERTLFTMARRVPKRMTDYDLKVPQPDQPEKPGSQIIALRRPPFKVVDFGLGNQRKLMVLFDLDKDPKEETPIVLDPDSTQSPEKELQLALKTWWRMTWMPGAIVHHEIPEETAKLLRSLGYLE